MNSAVLWILVSPHQLIQNILPVVSAAGSTDLPVFFHRHVLEIPPCSAELRVMENRLAFHQFHQNVEVLRSRFETWRTVNVIGFLLCHSGWFGWQILTGKRLSRRCGSPTPRRSRPE